MRLPTRPLRVAIRVYPGAARASVGGRYGQAEPPVLIVRVTARAVDGKANEAVVAELASAFDVPRRSVRIVAGHTSRSKVVEIDGLEPAALTAQLG